MLPSRDLVVAVLRRAAPFIVLAGLALLAAYAVQQIPPQHAPWARLSLEHPVGLAPT